MDEFCVLMSILLPLVLVVAIMVFVVVGAVLVASLIMVEPLGRAVIAVLLLGAGIWLARKLCAKYELYD